MKKSKGIVSLVLIAALLGLLGFTCWQGFGSSHTGSARNINLGLDLAGGVSITYQAKDKNPSAEDMKDTIYKLQKRVEQYSTEASVYQEGDDRINIEIPGVSDANKVLEELGKPGSLVFQDADGNTVEGETETNSVTLTDLPIGEYTIQIVATSTDEAYSDSAPIQLTFQRTKAESWRRSGTYTSAGTGVSYPATLVAYDDGSYTIESPFGEEGYSISFTVDADSKEISITGVTPDQYGYYPIYVSSQNYVTLYTSGGYSEFNGDEYEGEVWFGAYTYDNDGNQIGSWGYDDFTWSSGDEIPEGCKAEVPAMLTTTWGQEAPYYNATPMVDGKQCVTGCVATALAQILNYYQYPAQLADGTKIDWANMLPTYEEGKYSEAQANAVALLMARCGKVMNMNYGIESSTTAVSEITNGFADEFGYIVKYYGYRDYPTAKDEKKWKEIVFRELSAGRPVLYGGTSYKNGEDRFYSHSFVLDGYDSKGRVHANYGQGGQGDGYFPLDKLPMKYGAWDETFNKYQTLVVIHRPQDGSIDYDL